VRALGAVRAWEWQESQAGPVPPWPVLHAEPLRAVPAWPAGRSAAQQEWAAVEARRIPVLPAQEEALPEAADPVQPALIPVPE